MAARMLSDGNASNLGEPGVGMPFMTILQHTAKANVTRREHPPYS
jgi:hypothetical protein